MTSPYRPLPTPPPRHSPTLKDRLVRLLLNGQHQAYRKLVGGHWECYYPDTLFHGPGWQWVPTCTHGHDHIRDCLITCEHWPDPTATS